MSAPSRINFDLSPHRLDDGRFAIVADLYREDTFEVRATLTECPPDDVPDALARCRSHLTSLGMVELGGRPAGDGSEPVLTDKRATPV